MVQTDYKFDISISKTGYKNKNDIDWRKVTYGTLSNANFPMFEHFIKCGHTFAYCYTNTTFDQSQKTKANWTGTSVIFVDVDDCNINLDSFISNLSFPPSLYYTTQNHTDECCRFRLLYCFNEKITDESLFVKIYDSIVYQMEIDNNWKNKDNCGRSVNQQFAGNANLNIIYNNNYFIYDITEFDNVLPSKDDKKVIKNQVTREEHYSLNDLFNKNYLNDYYQLEEKEFLDKYKDEYPVLFQTELEYDECKPYILLPDDYIEIGYKYHIDKITHKTSIRRLTDGEHRRKHIFLNCMLRRLIKNDIHPEHLLYNAFWDYKYTIDNTKDPLSRKDVMEIVIRALKSDLTKYLTLFKKDKRKFKVNKTYCDKYGLTTSQARQLSNKLLKMEQVMNLYDFNLTDKENIKIFEENGIKCSLKTLQRYRLELGINKYNKE